jgi:hypothetical protein
VLLFITTVTYRDGRGAWHTGRVEREYLCIQGPRNAVGRDASAGDCHRMDDRSTYPVLPLPRALWKLLKKKRIHIKM